MSPQQPRLGRIHRAGNALPRVRLASTLLGVLLALASSVAEARSRFDEGPVEITADRFEYLAHLEVYTAEGRVEIVQEGRTLTADWIAFNSETRRAVASGRVEMREADDVFTAHFVEFDLDTLEGVMFGVDFDLGQDQFQLQAERLEKTGVESMAVKKATMTTCRCPDDGRIPWRLKVGEGDVELGDYATTRNTTVELFGVPAIWFPWLMFPVKTERETGLLFPEFAIGGTNGFEVALPIFWAPRQDLNVTFTPAYLTKRGFKPSLEIEYAIDSRSEGLLFGSFIHDQEVADEDWLPFGPNRWAAGWEHDQFLPGEVHVRADVRLVSDNQYAEDFNDMARYRSFRYLESTVYASRHFLPDGRLGLSASALWADDLQTADDIDRDPFLLQRLPEVDLDLLPGSNPWIPGLVTSFDTDYIYFFSERRAEDVLTPPPAEVRTGFLDTGVDATPDLREPGYNPGLNPDPNRDNLLTTAGPELDGVLQDGEPLTDRGSRLSLYPRLAYPLRFFDAIELYPEVGYYQTLYFTEEQNFASRGLATARVDLRTRFSGKVDLPLAGPVTHIVEPRLNWTYVQKRNQEGNPVFIPPTSVPQTLLRQLDTESIVLDPADRIAEANLLTVGAVNRVYSRNPEGTEDLLADVTVEAGYDLARSRFALINFDGRTLPRKGVKTRFNLSIDPVKGRIAQGRIDAKVDLPRWRWFQGGALGVGYRYRRDVPLFFSGRTVGRYDTQDPISQVDITTQLRLGPRWAVTYGMSFSLENEELLRNAGGISYTSKCKCWRVGVGVRQDRERDVQFDFLVTLLGMGDGLGFGAGGLAPGATSENVQSRY